MGEDAALTERRCEGVGVPERQQEDVNLVIRSLSGTVITRLSASTSDLVRVVKQKIASELGDGKCFQLVTSAGRMNASAPIGEALPGLKCMTPDEFEVTLVVTQQGWDRKLSGRHVCISPCSAVATSGSYSCSFMSAGFEAIGCSVFTEQDFSFAVHLVSLRESWITRIGVVRAGADGADACLINQSYAFCSDAEAFRGDTGGWEIYGNSFGAGDRIVVSYFHGSVKFMLNGADLGVAFESVPLPLRPYAFCDSHVAWELEE